MDMFQTPQASHEHSLKILESIAAYDDFMDGLSVICDMGCGSGLDITWWANAVYIDDDGVPKKRNYKCYGVDLDTARVVDHPKNLKLIKSDFETAQKIKSIDLLWSHDSFRYAVNPLETLRLWNQQMTSNGMIVLTVPQMVNIVYNKPVVRTFPGSFFNYNITNLIYMLAVSGFDCKDGHFVKYPNDPWVHCIAYKSEHSPMDPKKTSWYDLVVKGLLPDSADRCIDQYGYLRQEELQTHWITGHFVDWSKV
jgi:hypothetical protein